MSLKYEQYRSLHHTRHFLRDIMIGPRMPTKVLRERASRCLRHYPFLARNGEPIFSMDDFECPDLEDE